MNRKQTGNNIFQTTNRFFWALDIHIQLYISSLTFVLAVHCNLIPWGYSHLVPQLLNHLFETHHKLEIIGPNHLRIETVKTQTQPFDPQYGASQLQHSRCGRELLYSDIPGILKQTQKRIPNSHGYDHRGISYNQLGQPNFGNYPQNSSCGCTPKLTKGTHGVTFGIPGKDFITQSVRHGPQYPGCIPGFSYLEKLEFRGFSESFRFREYKNFDPVRWEFDFGILDEIMKLRGWHSYAWVFRSKYHQMSICFYTDHFDI